jgi:His/Glu/Gln/Arg/opine family amino acid ABC transporter permease subunit
VFDILLSSLPYMLKGAKVTLQLAAVTIAAGSLLGAALGVVAHLAPAPARLAVAAYVFVFRGIPVLVLIFLSYFTLPSLGVRIGDFSAVQGALIVYCSAYVAEIVRGALQSVARGQVAAAKALGMRWFNVLRLVTAPQAMGVALPPLLNNSVMMVKATAYVSVVGIWELSFASREIAQRSSAPFQVFFGAMAIYFLICYPMSVVSRSLERRTRFAH